MQIEITPTFVTSLSGLVVAMDHNPVGGAYLVTLTALVIVALARRKG
jgi:hypothetical protein